MSRKRSRKRKIYNQIAKSITTHTPPQNSKRKDITMSENIISPTIKISALATQKIGHWVEIAKGEVSGLGIVKKLSDRTLVVEDAILLKQVCSSSHTKLDSSSLHTFLQDCEDPSLYRFWWHSHASMECFWSGTDIETINLFCNADFLISAVVNKSRNWRVRLDIYNPLRLEIDHITPIFQTIDLGLKTECELEFKDKVSSNNSSTYKSFGEWWCRTDWFEEKTRVPLTSSHNTGVKKEERRVPSQRELSNRRNTLVMNSGDESIGFFDEDQILMGLGSGEIDILSALPHLFYRGLYLEMIGPDANVTREYMQWIEIYNDCFLQNRTTECWDDCIDIDCPFKQLLTLDTFPSLPLEDNTLILNDEEEINKNEYTDGNNCPRFQPLPPTAGSSEAGNSGETKD